MTQVLLAEDDPAIAEPLARALGREGYDVRVQGTGQGAIDAASDADIVVLDLGLPDMDGLDVARAIRAMGLTTPVLVLTARADEVDLVVGLDAGADDYVTKPFAMNELLARLRAAVRRATPGDVAEAVVEAGDLTIDLARRRVLRRGDEVRLSPTEWALVDILVRNRGKLVSRDQLLREVWGPAYTNETGYLRVYTANLRRKLERDPSHPQHFITLPGMGYIFETT